MTEIFSSLDKYVTYPRLSSLAVSPCGTRVVTAVSTVNTAKDGYVNALWEVDPTGETPAKRLTRSSAGESSPAFTNTGDLLFTSARPDETGEKEGAALWLLPADGGEARVLNRRPGGISSVIPASRSDVVLASAPLLPGAEKIASESSSTESAPEAEKSHAALSTTRKDASVQAILHDSFPVRYWDHDLGPARSSLAVLTEDNNDADTNPTEAPGWQLEHLSLNLHSSLGARFGGEAYLSPDGTQALISVTITEEKADQRSGLALLNVADGTARMLADHPEYSYSPGPISPDGAQAAVVISHRGSPQQAVTSELHVIDLATGELTRVGGNLDLWLRPASAQAWLPDGSGFIACGDADGRGPLFTVNLATGEAKQLTTDDSTYSEAQVSPDGSVVYALRSSYLYPTEVVRVDLKTGETTRLLNPVERPEIPGHLEEIETTAEDGSRVRAWLALPESASAETPAPLLLWIHGGPLGSWNTWTWRWNPWLAVQQGYAVLLPDPALSTGYGQEFIQRGWNSWGGKPFTDLMSITDATEARADIDETRTAAMGGSFGGYMANWVAGHTNRFRAIVTHASLWALDQFIPTTDMPPYWRRQNDEQMTQHHSPHLFVENIATPMLVIHGDKDYRVPIGEGLRLWYDLQARSALPMDADGNTAHRFLYFPDENHWILKPQHAKVWYEVVFAFLAEHLAGESQVLPEQLGLTAPSNKNSEE